MNDTEKLLYKAALLHDLGKFWQRSREVKNQKHQILSAKFVDEWLEDETIAHLVRYHHKKDWRRDHETSIRHTLALIVCEADNLASGERTRSTDRYFRPMESIFNQISINNLPLPEKKYQPIGFLSPIDQKFVFPKAFETTSEYDKTEYKIDNNSAWWGFQQEINALYKKGELKDLDLESLLYLYKKYLWCVPSAYYFSVPDISLYEHSRLTAAISICLYRSLTHEYGDVEKLSSDVIENRSEKRFLLVGGGFSGIQKYLYGIAHKGALKALKGRSFWLNQAVETVARSLLDKLDLPEANLIYANGGRFYLLLPYHVKDDLANAKAEVEDRIFEKYEGQLSLEFGVVDLSGLEIGSKQIADKWGDLNRELAKSKRQKMAGRWYKPGFFDPSGPGGHIIQCQFTKKDMFALSLLGKAEREGQLEMGYQAWKIPGYYEPAYEMDAAEGGTLQSRLISSEQFLGQLMGQKIRDKKNVIAFSNKQNGKNVFSVLNYEYLQFFDTENEYEQLPDQDIERIAWLNDDEFMNYRLPPEVKRTWKFYGGDWVLENDPDKRKQNDRLKDFEELAKEAMGIKRLGVLRMDVDNLGQIFRDGLDENATFSRITQLSTMLDFFFCGYLNRLKGMYWTINQGIVDEKALTITERERLKDRQGHSEKKLKDVVQIVYAGGDDLFIVSLWNILPDLALWIYKEFKRFTAYSPCFNLSAGLSLFRPKYPMYKAAIRAGEAEDEAKSYERYSQDKTTIIQKDAFSLFGAVGSWEDVEMIATKVRSFYAWLEYGKEFRGKEVRLDRSILNKLWQTFDQYQATVQENKANNQAREEALETALWSKARWQACYTLARFARQNEPFKGEIDQLKQELFLNSSFIQMLGIMLSWTELLTRKTINPE